MKEILMCFDDLDWKRYLSMRCVRRVNEEIENRT